MRHFTMRPRTNAKKVKSRAKAKAKAKAKVQAEADENKPTFAVDERRRGRPLKSTSFDALPEELQLKILRLALFEDAEEDVETKKNALRVETLKQPAVIPKRADEKPLYDDGYDPVPMGIWRGTCALFTYARLSCVSKGVGTLARDERLWAEPLALVESSTPAKSRGRTNLPTAPTRSKTAVTREVIPTRFLNRKRRSCTSARTTGHGVRRVTSTDGSCRACVARSKTFSAGARASPRTSPTTSPPTASVPYPGSLERTDKPPPQDCYQEVFTRDVTTRLLFNEYGRGDQTREEQGDFPQNHPRRGVPRSFVRPRRHQRRRLRRSVVRRIPRGRNGLSHRGARRPGLLEMEGQRDWRRHRA